MPRTRRKAKKTGQQRDKNPLLVLLPLYPLRFIMKRYLKRKGIDTQGDTLREIAEKFYASFVRPRLHLIGEQPASVSVLNSAGQQVYSFDPVTIGALVAQILKIVQKVMENRRLKAAQDEDAEDLAQDAESSSAQVDKDTQKASDGGIDDVISETIDETIEAERQKEVGRLVGDNIGVIVIGIVGVLLAVVYISKK